MRGELLYQPAVQISHVVVVVVFVVVVVVVVGKREVKDGSWLLYCRGLRSRREQSPFYTRLYLALTTQPTPSFNPYYPSNHQFVMSGGGSAAETGSVSGTWARAMETVGFLIPRLLALLMLVLTDPSRVACPCC